MKIVEGRGGRPAQVWCDEPAPEDGPEAAARHHELVPNPARVGGEHARENLDEAAAAHVSPVALGRSEGRKRGSVEDGMEIILERCAGLDVHEQDVVACVLTATAGGPARAATKRSGTMTADLEALASWPRERQVVDVVLEATGVHWTPVYNVPEAAGGFRVVIGNAEHPRAVPGRKPDVKDAHRLAHLLRHGLVRASCIPDREQRGLRELTRYRTALVRERASEVNRLQKTLEAANSKLAAVISDVTGVSGQAILDALVRGEEEPAELVDLAYPTVQKKREALERALVGTVSGTLKFIVERQPRHIRGLDGVIEECDARVAELARPFVGAIARPVAIPGVGQRTAEIIPAELGTDMARFPTDRHAAAWAGVCPGQNISAGKRRKARSRKGSPRLRGALAATARPAARSRDTHLAARSRQLVARRGKQRAIVAVSHSILAVIDHLLKDGTEYHDLGPDHSLKRNPDRVRRRSIQRLEARGYDVALTRQGDAA